MRILDSHVHFFDPSRPGGVCWPDAASALYRSTFPSDLVMAMSPRVLNGCIAVETSRRPQDDQWLLELSAGEELIKGVVLNLQPDRPGFEGRLARASESDKFVGVRMRPIERYDLSSAALHRSLACLERHGKTVEFGAKSVEKKKEFAELAGKYPNVTWILDHCGHPQSASIDEEWRAGIARIASSTNAVSKVSGLGGQPVTWRATLDTLVESFGAERLLYGSNWPVGTLAGNDDKQILAFSEYFGSEQEKFFFANARRAYGIGGSLN